MKRKDFHFDLPEELIAQSPIYPRTNSRLMILDKGSGGISHSYFYNLCNLLKKGDLLILNDTRVLPARIYGEKVGSGITIETLLLEQKEKDIWEILTKPGRRAKTGTIIKFGGGILTAEIIGITDGGNRLAKFSYGANNSCNINFYDVLDRVGQVPLPPYIVESLEDDERYQTVYSRELGSSAAPTAGLHFTLEMLDELQQMGVEIAYVTLHVGLGTFRPVKVDDINEHRMHSEHYVLPERTADMIRQTKEKGGRVIAVGTTSCRTLESAVGDDISSIKACSGDTDIFIYPGYKFRVIDGLITNFHLPESTLIMLVSAFAGYKNTMNAYNEAIKERYRFFSFGDAMIIL
ncbi:MAG: tRNA preQ1(34) S-adenosylmethionine ribosyltransferase-isomerase QueA [Clostridiales bacterium]|nr:tRNA preQ1(34) S-adenosylmethionine ribosyltransferase-isomerase QueA [Clostridiales bacterium]